MRINMQQTNTNAAPFWIPPNRRRAFILQYIVFVLAGTIVGRLISVFVAHGLIQLSRDIGLPDVVGALYLMFFNDYNNRTFIRICVSVGQYLTFRRYAEISVWWIGGSVLVEFIGLLLPLAGFLGSGPGFLMPMLPMIYSFLFPIAQWLVLRMYVQSSAWWLVIPFAAYISLQAILQLIYLARFQAVLFFHPSAPAMLIGLAYLMPQLICLCLFRQRLTRRG